MNNDYTIKAVKSKPKEWESAYGPMLTYLIQVEGNGEPIQLNKKASSPMPQVGDVIHGKIELTDFGQKFKSGPPPMKSASSGGSYQKSPEQEESIARAVALKAAVEHTASDDPQAVLNVADKFLAWLKGEIQPQTDEKPLTGREKAKAVAEKLKKPPIGSDDDENDLSWIRDEGE